MKTYHLCDQERGFYIGPGHWSRDVERAAVHVAEEWRPIIESLPKNEFGRCTVDIELVETFESLHTRAVEELDANN